MRMPLVPALRVRGFFLFFALFSVALFVASGKASVSLLPGPNAKDKSVQASSDQFVWRVDLHPQGYPANDPMLQRRRGLLDFDTLDFVSDTVEVATFLTQEPAHELRSRDAANPPPYTLHAVFLDAASGKALKTLVWPVKDANAGIFSRYDGSFLFFSTERIVLYSADWQPVKELLLPQLQEPHASLLDIAESPTGKQVVIRFLQDQSPFCVRIITGTLEGSEKPCALLPRFAISDQWMAAAKGQEQGKEVDSGPVFDPLYRMPEPRDFSILIRSNSGDTERLLCKTFDLSGEGCLTAQFVSDGRVVLLGGRTVVLSDLAGNAVFKDSFDIEDTFLDYAGRPARPSSDGTRFALALNESFFNAFGGGGKLYISASELPAEFPDRIQVFDMRMNNWVYILRNKKKQFPQIWGLALSPSGDRLAVDSGGVIQSYALPTTGAARNH
jgi:hypothetical protein